MKTILKIEMVLGLVLLTVFAAPSYAGLYADMGTQVRMMLAKQVPQPPAMAFQFSIFRTAPLQVAMVFGRTPGCEHADSDLIESTAKAAVDAGLDPAIVAATVGIESGCNQFAVSSKGALGLMQIVPKVWSGKFDFAGNVNLLNRSDNLRVGAQIEAGLISQYGVDGGVRRYNGLGTGCETCDAGYVSKILSLAGRR